MARRPTRGMTTGCLLLPSSDFVVEGSSGCVYAPFVSGTFGTNAAGRIWMGAFVLLFHYITLSFAVLLV